jgi:hypothetical protein
MATDQLPLSRQDLIDRLQEVAAKLGKRAITRAEFQRETAISEWQVGKHFDSWTDLVEAAGLTPYTQNVRVDDEVLLRAMRDAYLEAGGIVTRARFRKVSRYSDDVYKKRWGGFRNAQLRLREWVKANDPSFPYIDELPGAPRAPKDAPPRARQPASWPSQQTDLYGDFINFRGLLHAPVNEQGVVFLFGIVAGDLGFVVERVQTGYPDCEAKRRVKGGRGWERVRIEFEFRSGNFNHSADGCDLVVCWEHNWAECPVEVLELQSAIATLGE